MKCEVQLAVDTNARKVIRNCAYKSVTEVGRGDLFSVGDQRSSLGLCRQDYKFTRLAAMTSNTLVNRHTDNC